VTAELCKTSLDDWPDLQHCQMRQRILRLVVRCLPTTIAVHQARKSMKRIRAALAGLKWDF